jgi:GNAT superfamily N-acetyltransferase
MKILNFAPEDYPAIVDIHNSLNIVWPERPRTPEAWAAVEQNRDPKWMHQRWVAVEDGHVVGFSSYEQNPWSYPPKSFYVNIEIHSEYQRRGIGTALYDQIMEELQMFNPPALRADAFANLPQGFTFLKRRGFYEAFCETPVHLDVTAFDPSPYAGLEPKLKTEGIVIKTLRELESDSGRNRKVYNLYWEANEDVPHEGEQSERPDFDEWLGWRLNNPSILQDAYFIAVRGDEYIGLRELGSYADHEALLGSLLGIRREYRNHGIGLALQLRGIAFAREHSYRLLKTCTAIQNITMQALFNKLGYARDPEWQQCQKDIK